MQLQDLRVFVAVVELGRFTLAAQRLHTVQPAVSQAVMRLERELGLTLLERRPGGAVPTPAGSSLWRHAQVVLNSIASAEEDMAAHRELSAGAIKLGLLSGVTPMILTDLLRALQERYPGLRIHVEEAATPLLLQGIRLRNLDVAILLLPVEADDLAIVELATVPLVVAADPDHSMAGRKPVALKMLSREKWITFPPGNPGRIFLDEACRRAGFKPRIEAEMTSFSQLKAYVESGAGVSLLTRGSFSTEIAAGSLVPITINRPSPRATLAYAYDPNHAGHTPAIVRPVIEMVAAAL
jgi:DNA-binding transcriptional LysR family regulator